jgi:hypothetical protein
MPPRFLSEIKEQELADSPRVDPALKWGETLLHPRAGAQVSGMRDVFLGRGQKNIITGSLLRHPVWGTCHGMPTNLVRAFRVKV